MGIFLLLSFGLIAQEKTFFYYDDGSIESNGYLMKNKKEGVWEYYYQNGKIKEKGTYKAGIKDGPRCNQKRCCYFGNLDDETEKKQSMAQRKRTLTLFE